MNNEQPIQLGKWYGLLIFAAGSILTAIMSALDFGVGPMGGRSPASESHYSPGQSSAVWSARGSFGVTAGDRAWNAIPAAPGSRLLRGELGRAG